MFHQLERHYLQESERRLFTMARPTAEELILISKFRTRLNDLALSEEQRSDMQLVRWIRAREHSLDQAENMFRK
ncbi:unnamed protein product, partial [Allacma fusca]